MIKSRTTKSLAIMAITVMAVASVGCGVNRRYANEQIRQLQHSDVAIQYVVKESAVRPASAESPADQSVPSISGQLLSIAYPHPNAKLGRKYAEVVLRPLPSEDVNSTGQVVKRLIHSPIRQVSATSTSDNADDSNVIRMAIKYEDLEFLLRDLVADGFFDREERTGGVELNVTLGSRTAKKSWDHIAAFDQLAQRVETENMQRFKANRPKAKSTTISAELLAPTWAEDEPVEQPASEEIEPILNPAKF